MLTSSKDAHLYSVGVCFASITSHQGIWGITTQSSFFEAGFNGNKSLPLQLSNFYVSPLPPTPQSSVLGAVHSLTPHRPPLCSGAVMRTDPTHVDINAVSGLSTVAASRTEDHQSYTMLCKFLNDLLQLEALGDFSPVANPTCSVNPAHFTWLFHLFMFQGNTWFEQA